MKRLRPTYLCALALIAAVAAAENTRDEDLEELSLRLGAPTVAERLAAMEELFAWSLVADEAGVALTLLERASGDRSTVVSTQAAHFLRLLAARQAGYDGVSLSDHERTAVRSRRDAAQLRDLYAWRERLAHGDPASRLQAVKALATHARVVADRAEVLELLELSTADRDLAVAAQARAALEMLIRAGIAPSKGRD